MRRLIPLLLGVSAGSSLSAQAPVTFRATRQWHIDATTADFNQLGAMFATSKGAALVFDPGDNVIHTFVDGLEGTMGRKGEGPGEFERLIRGGWLGDSLWISDPALSRISIFGPNLKFARSFTEPITITSAAAPHDSSQTAFEVYVQAVLPNGNLRGLTTFRPGHKPRWAAGYDTGGTLTAQITPTGVLKNVIEVIPRSPCYITFALPGGGSGGASNPFCPARISTEWYGTPSVLSADTDPATSTYHIRVVDPSGVVTVNRSLPYAPVAVPASSRDSAVRARAEMATRNGPAWTRAAPKMKVYPSWPPVRRLLLGGDGTIWIEECVPGPGHYWRILDAKGNTVGTVLFPANTDLQVAGMRRLWAYETDEDGLQGLAMFELTPVKK